MLDLKAQRRWVTWPEANMRLLLSPLTISKRSEFYKQATEHVDPATGEPSTAKNAKAQLNMARFHELVAEECIHGWEGAATPYSKDAAPLLLNIEPANVFVFSQIQGLGLYMAKEIQSAGNA